MSDFAIVEGGPERLDDIQVLWEGLNRHHQAISPHFANRFKDNTFAARKAYLLGKSETCQLRTFLLQTEGQTIGYCVATLSPSKHGEIESIFLMEEHRGKNKGDTLMRAALDWLDSNGAESKSINVVFGNERAHRFYARYGFLPNSTTLSQA